MKKIHLILSLSAFVFASLGVFASAERDFAFIYRIDGPNPGVCDLAVTSTCDNTSQDLCTFSGTINGVTYTNVQVYDASVTPCVVLRKKI